MSYFPFFVELEGKQGLIVGGGAVAARKAEKLLPYSPSLTVVAPEIIPEIVALPISLRQRPFEEGDLEGISFVIAAATPEVNHRVAALCSARNLPVNVVDDPEHCSFLFPALVKQGNLSVGISTSGVSPSAAVYLKDQISALLPDHFEELLAFLESLRPKLKAQLPTQQLRSKVFAALFSTCMAAGRPLTEAEVQAVVKEETEKAL